MQRNYKKYYKQSPRRMSIYRYVANNKPNEVAAFLADSNIELIDPTDVNELCYKLHELYKLNPEKVADAMYELHPDNEYFKSKFEVKKEEVKEVPQIQIIEKVVEKKLNADGINEQKNINFSNPFMNFAIGVALTLLLINTLKK